MQHRSLIRDSHIRLDESGAVQGQGKQHSPDDAVDEELAAHVFPGNIKKRDVEDQAGDARGPASQIVKDHGDTGYPAGQETVLDEEAVDGQGHDETAQSRHKIADD